MRSVAVHDTIGYLMRLTGTLLEVEDYSGDFKGENGDNIAYAGQRLHVLDGREVVKVKIPKTLIGMYDFVPGHLVDLRIAVSAQAGARSPYLTVTLVGEYVSSPFAVSAAS